MKVRDAMTNAPVVIDREATAREAAARMARHRIRHLPVVDVKGLLVGIVTDRDLRHHLLAPEVITELGHVPVSKLLETARVREVMSWPVLVTSADADLTTAVATMRDRRVGALAVVEGRRLTGIITETDLLRRIIAADCDEVDVAAIVVAYP